MCLSATEAAATRRVTTEVDGRQARVKRFGSSTGDELRCRDMDLLIKLATPSSDKLTFRGGDRAGLRRLEQK